jgi:carbonic anhydrase
MPDDLLERLRRFHDHTFPGVQGTFEHLVKDGQRPTILFIGCSDSRLVPHLLTGAGPGELFLVRNVGAFVPPYNGYLDPADRNHGEPGMPQWIGLHGTAAAIEFAVLMLSVVHIVVCGHSHCGAVRALYAETPEAAPNLSAWLKLGREAALPVAEPGPEVLRRTEQRAVVLQLERLMNYPMVRERVEARALQLHGWHYVIEDGEVHVFDVQRGGFVAASKAEHSGTGPYAQYVETPPAGGVGRDWGDDAAAQRAQP